MTEKELTAISIAIGVLKRESMFENAEILKGLRTRLSLAAGASEGQEPVAQIVRGKTVAGLDVWDIKVFDKTLQNGTKLYTHPSAEIAALRERIADKEADNVRLVQANQDLRDQMRERIAGMEKDARNARLKALSDAIGEFSFGRTMPEVKMAIHALYQAEKQR